MIKRLFVAVFGGIFGPGTIVLGGISVLLCTLLVVGFFLPTSWSASVETRLDATPGEVLLFIDSPEGWLLWTAWPDSTTRTGPQRGAGTTIVWADPELGAGTFHIDGVSERGVTYSVEVAGAGDVVMRTSGTVELTTDGAATVVAWRERGDLGRNPLMGYWAVAMERAQSREMAKSLTQLASLVAKTDGPPAGDEDPRETPADSSATGAS